MPKIKDSSYKQFLDTGLIQLIDNDIFEKALNSIKHRFKEQSRALLILLYYTGARPSELLELQGEHFKKEGRHIKVTLPTKKGGRYRTLYLYNKGHIKEVYQYTLTLFPTQYLFWNFRAKSKKLVKYKTAKGLKVKPYIETTKKVRHHVLKWIGYTPYFLRHNRFSSMASKGASDFEIMFAKGSKSLESVTPYRHMSQRQAKKTAKYLQ